MKVIPIIERPVFKEICKQFDTYAGKNLDQHYKECREMFFYISDKEFDDAFIDYLCNHLY